MEAIQALQLQTDAKHRRITGQVMKLHNDYCTAVQRMARTNSLVGCFLIKAFWNLASITFYNSFCTNHSIILPFSFCIWRVSMYFVVPGVIPSLV